jgi:hypothetical protein
LLFERRSAGESNEGNSYVEQSKRIDKTRQRSLRETGRPSNWRPAVDRRLPLSLNDIRDRAYEMWVAAAMPPGDSTRFWLEAEQEMRERR